MQKWNTPKTGKSVVFYKRDDSKDKNAGYNKSENKMDYYNGSIDDDDIDDVSDDSENNDENKHRKRNVKGKKMKKANN